MHGCVQPCAIVHLARGMVPQRRAREGFGRLDQLVRLGWPACPRMFRRPRSDNGYWMSTQVDKWSCDRGGCSHCWSRGLPALTSEQTYVHSNR